jgi:cell division protein FtsB
VWEEGWPGTAGDADALHLRLINRCSTLSGYLYTMSTRLRRPSLWRQLLVTAALLAFQGYLGWSAIGGNFGIEGRKAMLADIESLRVQSGTLGAAIDAYRHKVALFAPQSLDPDILTEKARALLSMSEAGDMVVMVDPTTGEPISGLHAVSTENESMPKIEAGID